MLNILNGIFCIFAILILRISMIKSICRKPSIVLLTICVLTLTACSGRMAAHGSGPPASAAQITSFFSGKAIPNHNNGETYYATNGTVKSFQYFQSGPQVCTGTWRVSGSTLLGSSNCKWVEDGKVKSSRNQNTNYQVRNAGGYMDLIAEDGQRFQIGKLNPVKGFPREAEFNKLSKQLGL
jgi:hypothetical protein